MSLDFAAVEKVVIPASEKAPESMQAAPAEPLADKDEPGPEHAQAVATDTSKMVTQDFDAITADMRGQLLSILRHRDTTHAERCNAIAELTVRSLCRLGNFYFHEERRDFES